jgi:hypothetical protein
MKLFRALSLIGMVLVLATGSVTMSMARHQARAVDQIVICSGYGYVTISVDADGNPTGPILPCPDSVPALLAHDAGSSLPLLAEPQTLSPVRFAQFVASAPTEGAPRNRHSRAPPVSV